jgi:hypothetical protein
MAITKDAGRQYPLVAKVDFTYANLTDATAVEAVDLPANAVVTGGHLTITTVFNSATSDTIAVSGGGVTFLGATDVTSTGATIFSTLVAPVFTSNDTIDLTWDGTGTAPTTGAG